MEVNAMETLGWRSLPLRFLEGIYCEGYEWQLLDIEAFGKGPGNPIYEVSSRWYHSVEEAVESAREYAEKHWKGPGKSRF